MNTLNRPLAIGHPLTLWRVSAIVQEAFDVPDQPMEGEMDPFFFLTKEKNFIPHEYPCRTIFGTQYRDRRPDERTTPAPDRVWLGFGSPRLDLSGFWFRATRLAARAEALIVADTAGPARLRLATCGGAVLRVNGAEVLWTAAYLRNYETAAEVTVDLVAGQNRIDLFIDDLAERDTRFYAQIDYLDGPAAEQAIPVATDPDSALAVEAALGTLHFARTSHDGGNIALTLRTPLPVAMQAQVRIEGDFMSHDPFPPMTLSLPAGATVLDLGDASALPADFRHVVVRLSVDDFAAERVFGTEITRRSAQGPAPATLSHRVAEALQAVAAGGEADTVRAIARLALGDGGQETRAMIEAALPRIDACWDCADFALVPLIWCRQAWPDLLGTDLCARIDATIVGYRYWMDEPGNDVQWYFSENHALLFHTAAHLGGALLPDATFVRSGRSGADQSDTGKARLMAWFDHFEAWEMAEFNSAPYFPIDLKGLTALYALSPDATLRARAKAGIERLIEIVANSAHKGVLTAAQGRSYEHTLRASTTLELSAMARMLWGAGSYGTRFHATPQLAVCLRDHGLVLPDLTDRAVMTGPGAQEWRFAQGQDCIAKLYHHKTADHAMGSTVAYRWGDWGYQETLIHARLGDNPNAQIWINHPGEVIHSGYGRPSYWGGSASVPRVQQYRDLAIVVFDGVAPQPDMTHAWFPAADFDAAHVQGDTALAQSGAAHLMLRGSAELDTTDVGPTTGNELRLTGRQNWWLIRLGSDTAHGDAAAFAARFAELRPDMGAATITVDDPDYGRVVFQDDGSVEAEGRRIVPSDFTVRGHREMLHDTPSREGGRV
ncbi:hypothetical protein SAMN04488003_1227 [Loktanella fryxellensis]|uniref:Uncharacterized protein n=1 Tax=Loktanella fryxellensis TaxID=245187 RepID=A0A1H8HRC1_9RHOB|nr:hypothetical protein [Loktanella fryxellensis]SEN58609.1 hypothetical protein SAMN04488003_1227 [Loktanella fryxellensis]